MINKTREVEGFLWAKEGCFLEDNRITQDQSKTIKYYPFDNGSEENPMYLKFAYLDYNNPDSLLSFANSHGLLGLDYHPRIQKQLTYKNIIESTAKENKVRFEKMEFACFVLNSFVKTVTEFCNETPTVNPLEIMKAANDEYQKENLTFQADPGLKKYNNYLQEYSTRIGEERERLLHLFPPTERETLKREPLEIWGKEIIRMKWFVEIIAAIDTKNINTLTGKVLGYILDDRSTTFTKAIASKLKGFSEDDIISIVKNDILKSELNLEIEGISLVYRPQKDGMNNQLPFNNTVYYNFPSLLAFMYFLLLRDLTKQEIIGFSFCDYCGHSFPRIKPGKYCSDYCYMNAKNKRARERKKNK